METEVFYLVLGTIFAIISGVLATVISIRTYRLSHKDFSHTQDHDIQTRSLSDFDIVANFVGTPEIVKDRNEIYRRSDEIKDLIIKFKNTPNYDATQWNLHHKIWYIYTVYCCVS